MFPTTKDVIKSFVEEHGRPSSSSDVVVVVITPAGDERDAPNNESRFTDDFDEH